MARSCSRRARRRGSSTDLPPLSSSRRSRGLRQAMSSRPALPAVSASPGSHRSGWSRATLSRSPLRAWAPSATGWSLKKATAATGGGGQVARRPAGSDARIHSSNAVIEGTAMFESVGSAASAAGNEGHKTSRYGRLFRACSMAVAIALAAALAACSSSSSSGSSGSSGSSVASGSTLTVADVAPFSGVDAALGPTYLVSCDGAVQAINIAGGVLGDKLACTSADTRGDPADAVPAVGSLIANTKGLALVIGCTSGAAAAAVPVLNSNKAVMFCMSGQSEFDSVKFNYFYRLVPPDLAESYAMVVIAQQLGYKRIALAFGNDIGSQTFVQPAPASIRNVGRPLA